MLPSKHILVIRFSAMGDVAMMVPVIKNALQQNPSLQITVVSNSFFQPLFTGLERCNFHPAYLKEKHEGPAGILKLYKELKTAYTFDAVADMHNVLRSQLLRGIFKLNGIKISTIDKGRKEKKELTRKEHKIFKQLSTSHERYATVFHNLGVNVKLNKHEPVYKKQSLTAPFAAFFTGDEKIIGIAPFAQHKEKMYPIEKIKMLAEQLAAQKNMILLFGAKGNEAAILQEWENEMSSVINIAGKHSFAEELALISNLDVMLSMDSANMHLASLFNVPVISIWGATHPYAGFYGWDQDENNIISVDLPCRPCSVFGNKPCWRKDNACMNMITEEMILKKLSAKL